MTEEYYPGSKRNRKQYDANEIIPLPEEEILDLGKSKLYSVGGKLTELYPLGAVAKALNRQPVTVRKWESEGIIPRSPYMLPSHDVRGQRRLYTRQQIESLRSIARDEGLLTPNANGKWKSIEGTQFRDKALRAFKEGN